ncbi:MAG: NTP transferase domain-containing protein [Treponema sp.]|jgi:CTP:phosphocholine cytidylyltransferase-like protein/thiamine kinase-like enzyme|nr:NTP transferase domain-containing protein [Treponema sp.]
MYRVNNAIILAAGYGSRFIPITFHTPKGLIPVKGVPMIERQIRQLKEAGIHEIIIVVGYKKEQFRYLKDRYEGIKFVYSRDYYAKNNLSSLYCARQHLKNSYILSSDNWIWKNMFKSHEERSWYSCVYKEGKTSEWCVSIDDDEKITGVTIGGEDSWVMYGPVFLSRDFSIPFKEVIYRYYHKAGTEKYMWENVFIEEIKNFSLYINRQKSGNVYEFESLVELRRFDPESGYNTKSPYLDLITQVFNTTEKEISSVERLKAGMTNDSFSFSIGNSAYVFRRPGEGANVLINRRHEKSTYEAIKSHGICDRVVYFDDESGIKISCLERNAVNTDPRNERDVADSLDILRIIHNKKININHVFSIDREIKRYLNLLPGKDNLRYIRYVQAYFKIVRIINIVKRLKIEKRICHIDCNPDNFIRLKDNSLRLIDWEYAGLCDPIIDIGMYSIYSNYTKNESDRLLSLYLQRDPDSEEYMRLYAYMCLGGFLWMLWTEYKRFFGVQFGDYGQKMRQYADVYYDYTAMLEETIKQRRQHENKRIRNPV